MKLYIWIFCFLITGIACGQKRVDSNQNKVNNMEYTINTREERVIIGKGTERAFYGRISE